MLGIVTPDWVTSRSPVPKRGFIVIEFGGKVARRIYASAEPDLGPADLDSVAANTPPSRWSEHIAGRNILARQNCSRRYCLSELPPPSVTLAVTIAPMSRVTSVQVLGLPGDQGEMVGQATDFLSL